MNAVCPIRTALISVANKTNVIEFAKRLHQRGIKIISTGGTAKALSNAEIPITYVKDITGFPEMMEGRIKTLHPSIHGGILGKRDAHAEDAKHHGIAWIDLIVVNLYPFQQAVEEGVSFAEALEQIDIGGPAMLRAGAKNFDWVTVVYDPNDYNTILSELESGGITVSTRKKFAAKTFTHTAAYDAAISQYLEEGSLLGQEEAVLGLTKLRALRYGENPQQKSSLFKTSFGYGLATAPLLQGKELSYNNLIDAEAALQCVREFKQSATVIVKHTNPCGVAIAPDITTAYQKAFAADSQSAFGGIVALNRPCTRAIAQEVTAIFMEVILAPQFDQGALELLFKKPNLRVIELQNWEQIHMPWIMRPISGGLLVEENDYACLSTESLVCVTTTKPKQAEMEELLFAWNIVKHLKSNAIAITKDGVSIGLSGGQVSRIAAVRHALEQAAGENNAVLASDAFFPFRDNIDILKGSGIKALIQPGGSVRDQEIITACNDYGIAMVFTGQRCFKH